VSSNHLLILLVQLRFSHPEFFQSHLEFF